MQSLVLLFYARARARRYNELVEGELTFDWPASHETVAEECRAAREGVAFFDQSYFGKFVISGPDAGAAVQWLCGADMEGRAEGTVTYTPLCNARGGVEADLTFTRLYDGAGWYIAAGGNTATKDLAWIRRVLDDGGFDAHVRDESAARALLTVQGPRSRELLASLVDGGAARLADEAFPFSTCRELVIAGHPVRCLRLTFVGELGFEVRRGGRRERRERERRRDECARAQLHIPSESASDVYAKLREVRCLRERAGEVGAGSQSGSCSSSGGRRARSVDRRARARRRVSRHRQPFGREELSPLARRPLELRHAARGRHRLHRAPEAQAFRRAAVYWPRGVCVCVCVCRARFDFSVKGAHSLRSQALEAQRASGLRRKLVCLVLDDASAPPLHGAETIWRDGVCVGIVRSTAFGHSIGRTIAYGYVSCESDASVAKITNKWLSAGTYEIGNKGERLSAALHLKAPFDPENKRIRGEYGA